MTAIDAVKKLLEEEPQARERKSRYRTIRLLLWNKYGKRLHEFEEGMTLQMDYISDSILYDRALRKVQQDYPELRGSDYDEKKILEDEKKLELGYEPTYPKAKL